jgi:DeoR/GlpR family transcriptional regulator of sugar metabolism
MIVAVRNDEIQNFIKEQGLCSIAELARRFKISKVTVHRVLNDLEADGIVRKVRGGVKHLESQGLEKSYDVRFRRQVKEKQAIARSALDFIKEGSTFFLDSSTTMVYFAREIARVVDFPLTVITDSPIIVFELLRVPHIQVISTGGDLQYELNTFAGPLAYEAIEKLQFEKAFISAAAINPERGLMTAQSVLVKLISKIIEKADEATLLLDSSKFTKIAPLAIVPVSSLDRIITDPGLPRDTAEAYRALGIEVVIRNK